MAEAQILIISEPEIGQFFDRTVLTPAGYQVHRTGDWDTAEKALRQRQTDLVIVAEQVDGCSYMEKAPGLLKTYPFTPFCVLLGPGSKIPPIQVMREGFMDCWELPVRGSDVLRGVRSALARRQDWMNQVQQLGRVDTSGLELRMHMLESLERLGRKVTSMLDLDLVLNAVVDAAVELTGAEEGSLLLVDDTSGEFYMRASRNFQEEFARSFRLPVHNNMLAEMMRSGKPVFVNQNVPQKIKTSFLVHTLIYMPLQVKGRVIGALEADHRKSGKGFSEQHLTLMSALADYAAIAIENARLYEHTEEERLKLERILTGIDEAVIVVDTDGRLMLINPKAIEAFHVSETSVQGRRIQEVLTHPDLLEVLGEAKPKSPTRMEITLDDSRVLNAQITPLAGIGLVISMQDITYLKELDQIKSDFVHTVSHDLRSPLTAILGYAELIDRVGPVTEQQREFIRRVQVSVQNITSLINDLLDLGRIEAGFDARKEIIPLSPIVFYAIDGVKNRFGEKDQELVITVADDLPQVLGNPVRLRQMLNNLIVNAHKYAPRGGRIAIRAQAEGGQVILQIADNGPGIPPADQPYIFDKFYRASNVPPDTPGTGLGLAIVKSIVENHQGRVWVDSSLGKGTAFTIVLPIVDASL